MLSKGVLVFCAILHVFVASVESAAVVQAPKAEPGNSDWWKRAIFYQIYPRSFKDSNNDGIGDLQGIITKLPHLKDAGVTAAWLSPIYKSPQVDQGYDISDFKDIAQEYGTLADFEQLITKAHELGIKIVMDFVPNHSSDKHEWFEKSVRRETGYEDFYVWRDCTKDTPPNNWLSIFKNTAWKYNDVRQQCYLHQFAVEQPDLNYRHQKVVDEMTDVLKFWLDKGVDGFRMDAVPYLFEDDQFRDEPKSGVPGIPSTEHGSLIHIHTSDLPGTFDMIYLWREYLDAYTKEHGGDARVMMTEAYTDITNTMLYYGNDDREGAHFTFNFQLITKLNKDSKAADIVGAIKEWINYMPSKYTANWVLGNHDNHRVASRFGPENVDGFNMLTALLPGVLVTYNGEEIGQENGEVTWEQGWDPNACTGEKENFDKTSRDFERTPFHWDNSTNAGFNTGYAPWLPVSSKYLQNNLEAQSDANVLSHYQIYKQLIKLRSKPTLAMGSLKIEALYDSVVAYVRTLAGSDTYVYIFNIGGTPVTVNLVQAFPDLTPYLEIILPNSQSQYSQGNLLVSKQLTLKAHESIIATTTQKVIVTTTTTTTTKAAEETTAESVETTTADSAKISVKFSVILFGLICAAVFV